MMVTHCGPCPDHGAGVVPLGQHTQVVEVVRDELMVLEADGLVSGELDAKQGDVVGCGGRFTWMEPSERLEEEHIVNPPSWRANYQCFLHRQE
jgi:hypothetical protein